MIFTLFLQRYRVFIINYSCETVPLGPKTLLIQDIFENTKQKGHEKGWIHVKYWNWLSLIFKTIFLQLNIVEIYGPLTIILKIYWDSESFLGQNWENIG